MDKARVALEELEDVTAAFLDPKQGISLLLTNEKLPSGEDLAALLEPFKITIGEVEKLEELPY